MRYRIILLITVSFVALFPVNGFSQYAYELGVSQGFNGIVNNKGAASVFLSKTTITFCYSPDFKNGIRTGLSYSNNVQGSDALIEIPVYYSFKTKKETSDGIHEVDSFSGLISEVIAAFIPRRVEFNVGPSFGYLNRYQNYQRVSPSGNQYFSNEFVADRALMFSVDAGIRPAYVIGRVNISVGLGVGYLVSKNFMYSSNNSNYMGFRPSLQLKGDIGISFSF